MADPYIRNTAYHVSIQDLLQAPYERTDEEFEANYVLMNGKKVSRVNIIATVINQEKQEKVIRITVDDGTASIQIVSFEHDPKLAALEPGDVVLVIGRIREYNGQKYLIPEIIKPLQNHLWIEVRKRELAQQASLQAADSFSSSSADRLSETHEQSPLSQSSSASTAPASLSSFSSSSPLADAQEESLSVEEEMIGEQEEMNVDDMDDILTPQEEILKVIAELDQGEGADMQEVIETVGGQAEKMIEAMLREGEIYQIKPGKLKLL